MSEFFKKMGRRIERYFWNEKENLLNTENKAQKLNERLFLYYQILMSEPHMFLLNQKENFIGKKTMIPKNTIEIVLGKKWIT